MFRIPLRATLLAIAAFPLLVACGGGEKAADTKAPASAAAMAVSLAPAQARAIQRSVLAAGPIEAWEEMLLGVELSGLRVTALHVDVGQQVAKGEVLLELDHRTLDAELRQAQAALAEAEAAVELAKVQLARGEALLSRKLVSNADWDTLRANLVQARARAATARAQHDHARLRRDYATLRAPDAGVISRRGVQPGQVVAAGDELLRLVRQGRLEWRPELGEAELARVTPGARALLPADGGVVEGSVRAVSPGLDATTRTGLAHVDLPAPGALRQGMYVEGRIVTGEDRALMVPAAAVVHRDGYPYVFTVDAKGIAQRLRVRIGTTQAAFVEVLEGLAEGQAVVAEGAGFLADGDRVRVVAATAQR